MANVSECPYMSVQNVNLARYNYETIVNKNICLCKNMDIPSFAKISDPQISTRGAKYALIENNKLHGDGKIPRIIGNKETYILFQYETSTCLQQTRSYRVFARVNHSNLVKTEVLEPSKGSQSAGPGPLVAAEG